MQLSTVCSAAPILTAQDADEMNKGMHKPTFELPEHGKLRVKCEIGELPLLLHDAFLCFGVIHFTT